MLNLPKCACDGRVFEFFEEISKIPRGSGNTDAIADYLVGFAKERSLDFERDAANNVIIKKKATLGYEGRPTVIIQGHTDMVLASDENANIDLQKDALKLYIDGDFIKAEGTTLGADDGVAVAYALALLDSENIPHPAIEAVFTSDEEIGLIGATAIDATKINGRILLNIDSDAEGIFTAGCAGGLRTDTVASFDTKRAPGYLYIVEISNLRGGHSGVQIGNGRVNAIKYLCESISDIEGISLMTLEGGNADNAIPREAQASFTAAKKISGRAMTDLCNKIKDGLRALGEVDANVTVARTFQFGARVISKEDTSSVLSLINKMPSGVLAMSADIEGLVETSQNLGTLKLENGTFHMAVSVRSSKDADKRAATDNIYALAKKYGLAVSERGDYPAWEYRRDSHLRDTICKVYEQMYNKAPKVDIIHAGLECGIFGKKLDGLDAISFGPNNYDIHTPSERLSISSTVRVWEFILEVLKNI